MDHATTAQQAQRNVGRRALACGWACKRTELAPRGSWQPTRGHEQTSAQDCEACLQEHSGYAGQPDAQRPTFRSMSGRCLTYRGMLLAPQ
eukprot:7309248-Lingulodinium_polyedra.AAC.1